MLEAANLCDEQGAIDGWISTAGWKGRDDIRPHGYREPLC